MWNKWLLVPAPTRLRNKVLSPGACYTATPWRRWVCSLLGAHEHLHVVDDAADGLEAVQRAQVLKPDLILLDIGLPTLNGIEAAHRIAKLVSEAIFITVLTCPPYLSDLFACGPYPTKTPQFPSILCGRRLLSSSDSGSISPKRSLSPHMLGLSISTVLQVTWEWGRGRQKSAAVEERFWGNAGGGFRVFTIRRNFRLRSD